MSALVSDLNERGLLDDTLIIWMGEFGRTPQINNNGGRDHYAKAWTTRALSAAASRAARRSATPTRRDCDVSDRPISAIDFMATVCRDPRHRLHQGIDRQRPADPHRGQG